jgi:hypothetical protein
VIHGGGVWRLSHRAQARGGAGVRRRRCGGTGWGLGRREWGSREWCDVFWLRVFSSVSFSLLKKKQGNRRL